MMNKKGFSFQYWIGMGILVFIIVFLVFLGIHEWDVKAAVQAMTGIFG